MQKITVEVTIHKPKSEVWSCYTDADKIVKWNFADPSWHCPAARNDLRVGGKYWARMEAKDGTAGFDFEATYTRIILEEVLEYSFGDRHAEIKFLEAGEETQVIIAFDPETENPAELQSRGWQAILNHFKSYCESLN